MANKARIPQKTYDLILEEVLRCKRKGYTYPKIARIIYDRFDVKRTPEMISNWHGVALQRRAKEIRAGGYFSFALGSMDLLDQGIASILDDLEKGYTTVPNIVDGQLLEGKRYIPLQPEDKARLYQTYVKLIAARDKVLGLSHPAVQSEFMKKLFNEPIEDKFRHRSAWFYKEASVESKNQWDELNGRMSHMTENPQ